MGDKNGDNLCTCNYAQPACNKAAAHGIRVVIIDYTDHDTQYSENTLESHDYPLIDVIFHDEIPSKVEVHKTIGSLM